MLGMVLTEMSACWKATVPISLRLTCSVTSLSSSVKIVDR